MEELFDIYTRDGKHLGAKTASECHAKGVDFYHKPAWIWIINNNGKVLVQKRAARMRNQPNKWDMSSAGHVTAGEKPVAGAKRETFEELGIDAKESEYEFVCEYICDYAHEIAQVFLLKTNLDIPDMNLQKKEVAEVKWLDFDEFKEFFYSKEFVKYDERYREIVLNLLKERIG